MFVSRCSFSRAAITKYHRPRGSNGRNVFSHSSGGQGSTVSAARVSSKASPCVSTRCEGGHFLLVSLLGVKVSFSPYVITLSFLCACLCLHLFFLKGHQSHWIRVQHNDLILTQLPL